MRLDTITRIERFISDAILSSTQIPEGVNIIRLAATQDEEGIANLARTITVRYTGSDVTLQSLMPLTQDRRMSFEVILASQSYLTESGHDYVVQMCAGVYNTLTNQVPTNTGVQIMTPLHMIREEFQGLTDNSQFVYSQTWACVAQEIDPQIAIDPCVQRGNCSYLFPENTKSVIKPGEVLYGNTIYSPTLPVPNGFPATQEYCGVVESGDNLVYKHDTDTLFLADWANYTFVSTETFDTTNTFLIVNVYTTATGEFFMTYMASDCENRKAVQIGGAQPGEANWLGGLIRSPIGKVGNPSESGTPEPFQAVMAYRNSWGYVAVPQATIYSNPSNSEAATAQIKYGALYGVATGTLLVVEGVTYIYIGGTPLGKAWIKRDDFQDIVYEPRIDCTGPEIECGVPEGAEDPMDTCLVDDV